MRYFATYSAILTLLALICWAPATHADELRLLRKGESVSFWIKCEIAGETRSCMMDSGATIALVQPLRPSRRWLLLSEQRMTGALGLSAKQRVLWINQIKVGPITFENTLALEGSRSSTVQNFVGASMLSKRIFRFRLGSENAFEYLDENTEPGWRDAKDVHKAYRTSDGLVLLPVTLGSHASLAFWDTGYNVTSVDERWIRSHPADFTPVGDVLEIRDFSGKSALRPLFRAKRIQVGSLVFRDVLVSADPFEVNYAHHPSVRIVVGAQLMAHFPSEWLFDLKRNLWSAVPSRPGARTQGFASPIAAPMKVIFVDPREEQKRKNEMLLRSLAIGR